MLTASLSKAVLLPQMRGPLNLPMVKEQLGGIAVVDKQHCLKGRTHGTMKRLSRRMRPGAAGVSVTKGATDDGYELPGAAEQWLREMNFYIFQ